MRIFDYLIVLFSKHWFNPFFTLWINFRFLPLKQAIHLPICVWGVPKIIAISNDFKIVLDCNSIKRGLIKINRSRAFASHSGGHSEFLLCGHIVFKGSVFIGCGTCFSSYPNSTIIIGDRVTIGQQNIIASCEKIVLEDNVRIGSRVQIMDSSMHFIYQSDERKVNKVSSPIIIKHNTWIANGASIYKGSILPPYSTVAGGSMINRDFSLEDEGTCFVGTPAKPKIRNFYRIQNLDEEMKLVEYFSKHNQESYYYEQEPPRTIFNT